jgi:hypothetical protein
MNWVKSRDIGARVSSSGAPASRRSLSGSVCNTVTTARASSLEGVEKSKPVANFVCNGLALVEVGGRSARSSSVQDAAAVILMLC